MKNLLFPFLILVLLVSCKSKNENSHPSEKKMGPSTETENTIPETITFDTIIVPNAPRRITRNVKLDREGRVLMASYDDIIRYDGESFYRLEKQKGLTSWYAFDVLEDTKGNIWIASDQSGAYRIEARTGKITHFTTQDGLGHHRNMCIYEDRAGHIWIGGQGGLSKFDGKEFTTFTMEDGLPHNDINTILEDANGHIWFGTRGNAGIFDGHTFSELKNDKGEPFFNVWSIMEDTKGVVWLVDSVGLWKYSNGRFSLKSSNVWKVYEDQKGRLWSTGMLKGGGSELKLLTSTTDEHEMSSLEVFHSSTMFFGIVEDGKGNIWVGGGDGVWCYEGEIVHYFTGIGTNDVNLIK